ncbi:MAG: hydantoinase B/oxoprolinase family protein [Deltaproteobacteria bacterium]|nr:hydantoinase B/oxoprolinase family protein [Deltaproteobacteria bacterium]
MANNIGDQLDPVKYEVLYHRLEQEMFEAQQIIRHLSASTIVREAGEVAEVICLKEGTACIISAGLLVHVASVTRNIRHMIANRYADDIGFYDGDQFIGNDCHIGGMHIPDMMLIAPFFYKGEHIGWLGNYTHVPEVGAIEPGGMCATAKEFCHEGIRMPGVKISERGRVKRDIMQILTYAVRDPKTMEIDTRAKIAGNERARQRLTMVIDEFGLDFYLKATQKMVDDAEDFARAKVKRFKSGKYRARTYTDSVSAFDQKIRVGELCMEAKEDGTLALSTPVASPQAMGYNNCAMPAIEGLLFCVLLWQLYYESRWNTGMLAAVEMDYPLGSVFNADRSAAVGYCPIGIGMQLQGCLNDLISRASFPIEAYEDMMASNSLLNCPTVGGLDRYGRTYGAIITSTMACGGGARYDKDGQDCSVTQFNPWDDCGDVETEEVGPVLMFTRRERADSGGLGRFRGGLGAQSIFTPHRSDVTFVGLTGSGGYLSQVQGMYGGYPTPAGSLDIVTDSNIFELGEKQLPIPVTVEELDLVEGNHESVYPSAASRPLKPGDLFCVQYWGGGGSGDPIERDPAAIAKDLKDGRTHIESVENVYCAKIDPQTFEVDEAETQRLREERKKDRLAKGIPGKEYIKGMVEKRKNNDLPEIVEAFFEEITGFSEGFRNELAFEEEFAAGPDKEYPTEAKEELFKLTPYVSVMKADNGQKVLVCAECGKVLCEANENFKLFCLIYDRDAAEIYVHNSAPKKDWMIFREFYCPGCGAQMEVEGTPEATPIVHTYELNF